MKVICKIHIFPASYPPGSPTAHTEGLEEPGTDQKIGKLFLIQ